MGEKKRQSDTMFPEENIETVNQENLVNDHSSEDLKSILVNDGINSVDDVVDKKTQLSLKDKNVLYNNLFSCKEIFDRIGYGFAAHQFITILFFFTGAPIWLVGIISGAKDVLSVVFSSLIQKYSTVKSISNKFISRSGILFGFSFLIIAFAIKLKLVWLFAIAFLFGSLGVVTYGELYGKLLDSVIKHEKRGTFLKNIAHLGLIITGFAFLASGIIMDHYDMGYLVAFEIASVVFILSGFVLSKIPSNRDVAHYPMKLFFHEYLYQVKTQLKMVKKNRTVRLMFLVAILFGVIQSLGNAYYGYFIYTQFENMFFGGLTNVAVLFSFAILVSFIGPALTRYVQKNIGLTPMLVFGTLLVAMMPLVLAYNPHFYAVLVACGLAVIGSSIVGIGQGMLARKLLDVENRKLYFRSLSIIVLIPYIILIPIGAFIADIYGFVALFRVLLILLVAVVAPLNISLVIISQKRKL